MKNNKRIIFALLTLLWCFVIYSFSNTTGDNSGSLSLKITHFLLNLFYPSFYEIDTLTQTNILEVLHLLIRKMAHMTEYAILYFFVYQFLTTYNLSIRKTYFISLLFSVVYAMFDEFHQLFIEGRAGSFIDVAIDTLGALCMLFVIVIVKKCINKFKKVQ